MTQGKNNPEKKDPAGESRARAARARAARARAARAGAARAGAAKAINPKTAQSRGCPLLTTHRKVTLAVGSSTRYTCGCDCRCKS